MPIPPPRVSDSARQDGAPALTDRDLEALRHLADGRSTAQIATAMAISSNTVRTRVHRIKDKLAVASRGEVVSRARDLGVL